MDTSLEAVLEAETLAAWVEQSPVADVAGLYDWLREGLAAEYVAYREARKRGLGGQADADRALSEVLALVALLDAIAETLAYRRGLYLHSGRVWPLVC
jgi:hypothetical protein